MPRISGIDLPIHKRTDIALTMLFGVGRNNVQTLITQANVDGAKRIKDLSEEEVNRIQKVIESSFKVEGDLRQEIGENIQRLRSIGSYRGIRHARGLPVHGQRTRSNGRTRRGKRKTVGAMKKEVRAKLETAAPKKA